MTEMTRAELASSREELRRDRRREYRLLWQAGIALLVVAAIAWARTVFFA